MKAFAIIWIVLGAVMVSVAAFFFLTQGFGPASTTIIATMSCIGIPFAIFGIWGLYAELKPYHYQRRTPK
jgi:membrane protein CcdC involved in cytochrome C biogenesis